MRESVGRVLLEIVVGWWAVIRLNLRFHLAIISTSHQQPPNQAASSI